MFALEIAPTILTLHRHWSAQPRLHLGYTTLRQTTTSALHPCYHAFHVFLLILLLPILSCNEITAIFYISSFEIFVWTSWTHLLSRLRIRGNCQWPKWSCDIYIINYFLFITDVHMQHSIWGEEERVVMDSGIRLEYIYLWMAFTKLKRKR